MWRQSEIQLSARSRGFRLFTDEIVAALPVLREVDVGLLHLFLQHPPASLTLNENADPTVRGDCGRWFNPAAPDHAKYFRHVDEGATTCPRTSRAA